MSFGNKIKHIRLKKGFTQVELSEISQVPQSVISDIENEKRKHGVSVNYLQRIAKALDVPVTELLEDDQQSA